MAEVKHNKFTPGLSGKLGSPVFSEEQLAHQSHFQRATAYASVASQTNPLYAQLAAGTSKTAYNIALSDWFNPPVIHTVTRQDSCILVDASDNVQVTSVLVTISDDEGQTLEQGQASLIDDTLWEYETSAPTEANVTVDVFDLAGNVTRQEV